MLKCVVYSWEEIYKMCEELGRKIASTGFKPDVIVAIARGGWVPARILCDVLDVRELYSVKAEHWGRVATPGEAKLVQSLNVKLDGKTVLLVDDVTDTGETCLMVKEHLNSLGASEVKIAVLDHKATSKFLPDFFVRKMESWKWIVYPWSYYEDTRDFIEKHTLMHERPEKIQRELKERYDFDVDLRVIEYVVGEYGTKGVGIEEVRRA
ncbi:phosphoribosyltransferase [Archaeoglobales archaeon]|nr:MAG: phosphoribosyltransferase [Archaeoglobales archaeon]